MSDTGWGYGLLAGIAALIGSDGATAQTQIFDTDVVSTYIDFRLSTSEGVASWTQSNTGKTQFGDGSTSIDAQIAEAGLVWRPKFGWTVSGYAHLQFQDNQSNPVNLVEAFLRYKPVPTNEWRITGRAGVFYPPVSMEHVEEAWATYATISASAINSWIGEEVKGTGIEIRAQRAYGDQELAITGGLFGNNDTTGVLISYRGWALHDIKTGWDSEIDVRVFPGHDRVARPFHETDNKPGYYARIDWSPRSGIDLNIIRWDNLADPTSYSGSARAWRTKFVNIGASWQISDQYQLIGQAMSGTTVLGTQAINGRHDLDFQYSSAFALLVREQDRHVLGLRADWFDVDDRSSNTPFDGGENGWAGTASYRYNLSDHQSFAAELLHVSSDRPLRVDFATPVEASQTQFQLSWRLSR